MQWKIIYFLLLILTTLFICYNPILFFQGGTISEWEIKYDERYAYKNSPVFLLDDNVFFFSFFSG